MAPISALAILKCAIWFGALVWIIVQLLPYLFADRINPNALDFPFNLRFLAAVCFFATPLDLGLFIRNSLGPGIKIWTPPYSYHMVACALCVLLYRHLDKQKLVLPSGEIKPRHGSAFFGVIVLLCIAFLLTTAQRRRAPSYPQFQLTKVPIVHMTSASAPNSKEVDLPLQEIEAVPPEESMGESSNSGLIVFFIIVFGGVIMELVIRQKRETGQYRFLKTTIYRVLFGSFLMFISLYFVIRIVALLPQVKTDFFFIPAVGLVLGGYYLWRGIKILKRKFS